MTYTVSSGMLNSSIPYHTMPPISDSGGTGAQENLWDTFKKEKY